MENENLIEKLASQFGQNASVKNIYGEPIHAGDKTIIPVAQIAYGLGGGYGQQKKDKGNNPAHSPEETLLYDKQHDGEGGGAGGGMYAKPKGVYEVTNASTRFIPASNTGQLIMGLFIGFILRGWFKSHRRK
jgi:uncharacterized spore protein YtfJ